MKLRTSPTRIFLHSVVALIAVVVIVFLSTQCSHSDRDNDALVSTPLKSKFYIKNCKSFLLTDEYLEHGITKYKHYKAIYSTCIIYSIGSCRVMDIGMARIAIEESSFQGTSMHYVRLWDEIPPEERMDGSESSGYTGVGDEKVTIKQKNCVAQVDNSGVLFLLDNGTFKYKDLNINILHSPSLIIIDRDGKVREVRTLLQSMSPKGADKVLELVPVDREKTNNSQD